MINYQYAFQNVYFFLFRFKDGISQGSLLKVTQISFFSMIFFRGKQFTDAEPQKNCLNLAQFIQNITFYLSLKRFPQFKPGF
jgi:hypothetical protein